MEPIKYGMFIMPYHAADKPLDQGFDEDLELVVRAEELGFEVYDETQHAKGYQKRLSLINWILGFFMDKKKYMGHQKENGNHSISTMSMALPMEV